MRSKLRGKLRINFLEYKELVHNGCLALTLVTYGAHLGDVLDLGEPEGHAEAAEEDGDERAAVAEGREAELPHRRRPSRERRLHPLKKSKPTYQAKGSLGTSTMDHNPNPSQIYRDT